MERSQHHRRSHGRRNSDPLSAGARVAEEAFGTYKDVGAVVAAAERTGLARRVAGLRPLICIKG